MCQVWDMCDRQQFNKALHNSLQFACCLNECREEKTYRLVSPALCQPTPSPAESESEAWLLLWLRSITLPPNEAMDGLGMTRLIFSYPFVWIFRSLGSTAGNGGILEGTNCVTYKPTWFFSLALPPACSKQRRDKNDWCLEGGKC